MPDNDWQTRFEAAWADREERLYPSLFGATPKNIFPLSLEIFEGMAGEKGIDPRWLTYGVFECPPNDIRSSWLYVSSGLSNAWEDDFPNLDSWSGLGCEFILQTAEQAQWAQLLLRRMVAFQICLAHGRFPGKDPLAWGDRIPLRAPIDGKSSALTFVLTWQATGYEGIHQIASGKLEFVNFNGVTEDEVAFAREHGSDKLYRLLVEKEAAPVTRPERGSVLR